ncbi:hypothetical protein EMIHUDRAFT_247145 [Emiliania huxleyi CCMP1516]|uniref:Uncharacterized protein n=2 Tax=Emiliania huxleyi TaxID=2903 RepID=A0A0D3IP58_EMIH1|nr:hypothetical protein EMIHUDRAFT_247145 [Emiliania huxleyi CCMP1516]EOD13043.1 hypothetical protein EMIHUDRAFT_247145 [Emiliania huxleyi CCMP1516]|eukprot:XP_005765472.1 hypothetical protein EMIHUDRAFT_247145 [Emiliania huxleyi CCMP1516]
MLAHIQGLRQRRRRDRDGRQSSSRSDPSSSGSQRGNEAATAAAAAAGAPLHTATTAHGGPLDTDWADEQSSQWTLRIVTGRETGSKRGRSEDACGSQPAGGGG